MNTTCDPSSFALQATDDSNDAYGVETRIPPTPAVREELEQLLEDDVRLLGAVYRHLRAGKTAKEIAEEMDYPTQSYVYLYRRQIHALLDGVIPAAPSLASQTLYKVSSILKRQPLSAEARTHLEQVYARLERSATDEASLQVEEARARHQTASAEQRQEIGIYVYTLPHYLRHPLDLETGRTLMKIGHSSSDIVTRFRQQGRITALPEDPVLLRIYRTEDGDSNRVEREFHALLDAADHVRSAGKSVGREWFVTSVKFLDQIAKSLNLDIVDVNATLDAA